MKMDEFLSEIRRYEQIIVYGGGWAGKIVQEFLQVQNITVQAFAVTQLGEMNVVNGIPVYGLDDILLKFSQAYILVAVTKRLQPDLVSNLQKRELLNNAVVSEALVWEMRGTVLAEKARLANEEKQLVEGAIGYLSPGYLDTDYAEKRLIVGRVEDAAYVALPKEIRSVLRAGEAGEEKLEAYKQLEEACYYPEMYEPNVSWIHTFNSVCRTILPWCATFETSMPRIPNGFCAEYRKELVKYMKQPNCKAMFALCENARKIQERNLTSFLPQEDVELLMKKTHALPVPQPLLVEENDVVERAGKLSEVEFIFIGNGFFFKGGKQIIDVLSKLEGKYDFKLTLISSMMYNDYFTKTSYEEMLKYKNIILQKPWIDFYQSLPNEIVLEKCKKASVGLLPSFGDTYGYAVLEMQAAGCPVVTTNIRAFPELNNEECGWVCNVPVDELVFCTERDMNVLSLILEKELERVFEDILAHPEKIREKGLKAWRRIAEVHNPEKYSERLRQIMDEKNSAEE